MKKVTPIFTTPFAPKAQTRYVIEFIERRRKVPGGAAGLQNWQARLQKVNANEALAITHRFHFFISSFQIFHILQISTY